MDMRKYDAGQRFPLNEWMRKERFHRWFWPTLALVEVVALAAMLVAFGAMMLNWGL
jgi:hypothetical protein